MAHPCPRGCISRCNSAILAYRATALRHLGVAIHELWLPRPHRISTGLLVSQSVGMAPDHAATGRLQHGHYNSAGTKAAPEKSSYHPCRCCAQGRFSAPSLPDSAPTGDMPRKTPSDRFRPPQPVVTGHCASDRPLEGHRHGAHHRLVGAGHLHVRPVGVRRPAGTLRPLSTTAISRTCVALPGPSARTATMRPWVPGSSGSTRT